MIEISIKNTDITPMWYLLGTDIYLSFEKPGPIKVDETKLTPAQFEEIKKAVSSNTILLNNNQINNPVLTPQQLIEQQRYKKREEAQQFLNQKLSVLKKNLSTQSITFLRMLLEEEKFAKNRKSVVKLIEQLISKHQANVFLTVGKESLQNDQKQDYKDIFGKLNSLYGQNISMIEESDEKVIEITVGD